MFSETQVLELAPKLSALEAEEPVISAWRCMAGRSSRPVGFSRRMLWLLRDFMYKVRPLARPLPNQIVAVTHSMAPSTIASLRLVLHELRARGCPAFIVTNRATRGLLKENLHIGHADLGALCAALPWKRRSQLRRRAGELAFEVKKALPVGKDGQAAAWIERGLVAREATLAWLGPARTLLLPVDTQADAKGMVLAAKRLGIPSVVLQHGMIGAREFPVHASYMFCWGDLFAEEGRQLGAPAAQLVPVGSPRMDSLERMRQQQQEPNIRAELGGRSRRPLLMAISTAHATPRNPSLYAEYFESIRAVLQSGTPLALKLHPAEQGLGWYEKHLPENLVPLLRLVPRHLDLHTAMRHADAVFHVHSAAALEAMLLGVPVLTQYPPAPGPTPKDLPQRGGGLWTSAADIVERLCRIVKDASFRGSCVERQDQMLDLAFANRGRATQSVVEQLLRLSPIPNSEVALRAI